MSKKTTKSKSKPRVEKFFHNASLQLNREIERQRLLERKQAKRVGSFISELDRAEKVSPIYHRAKAEGMAENFYNGKAVNEVRPIEEEPGRALDPSKVADDSPAKGFVMEQSINIARRGVKI